MALTIGNTILDGQKRYESAVAGLQAVGPCDDWRQRLLTAVNQIIPINTSVNLPPEFEQAHVDLIQRAYGHHQPNRLTRTLEASIEKMTEAEGQALMDDIVRVGKQICQGG